MVIVCRETGSGKSTQISQFFYKATFCGGEGYGGGGDGLIGIAQPGRWRPSSLPNGLAKKWASSSPIHNKQNNHHWWLDTKSGKKPNYPNTLKTN